MKETIVYTIQNSDMSWTCTVTDFLGSYKSLNEISVGTARNKMHKELKFRFKSHFGEYESMMTTWNPAQYYK